MRIVPGFVTALTLGAVALLSGSCAARKIDEPGALRKFLAGKEISPAKADQSFMLGEKFFDNGAWEGTFAFIDLTIERGSWFVTRGNDKALLLCTKSDTSNGRVLRDSPAGCVEVEAFYGARTATLTTVSNPPNKFEVTISNIKK